MASYHRWVTAFRILLVALTQVGGWVAFYRKWVIAFRVLLFCFTQLFFRYASFTTVKSVDQERKRVKRLKYELPIKSIILLITFTWLVYLLDHAIDVLQRDFHLSEVCVSCEAYLDGRFGPFSYFCTITCLVPVERGRKSRVQATRGRERPFHLSLFSALPIVFALPRIFAKIPTTQALITLKAEILCGLIWSKLNQSSASERGVALWVVLNHS